MAVMAEFSLANGVVRLAALILKKLNMDAVSMTVLLAVHEYGLAIALLGAVLIEIV